MKKNYSYYCNKFQVISGPISLRVLPVPPTDWSSLFDFLDSEKEIEKQDFIYNSK